jgi:glycosyltransferase involved in cell wall biosynthesis
MTFILQLRAMGVGTFFDPIAMGTCFVQDYPCAAVDVAQFPSTGTDRGEDFPEEIAESARECILPSGAPAVSSLFKEATETLLENSKSKVRPILPANIFYCEPHVGGPILRDYLNALPEDERYGAMEPFVRQHWKWMCKVANYLQFPDPKPPEGEKIRLGIRVLRFHTTGVARAMQLLANYFAQNPHYEVTVFVNKDWRKRIDFPVAPNVSIVSIGVSGMDPPIDWKRQMLEHPQDVMICPQNYRIENYKNILLLKALGVRVLAQEHFGIARSTPFANAREKEECLRSLYSTCDAVSCLSRADLHQWQKIGVQTVVYLPNPPTFDPQNITPSPLDSQNILWVGRFERNQKRPDLAIEAFEKILPKVPDARLVLLGGSAGNNFDSHCKKKIHDMKIEHAVEFPGFQKDLTPYYSKGSVLMCTSRYEGFGMMINEAKAYGIPVVSMEMPYLETLNAGCVQTPQGDTNALADAIIELLENDQKRKALGVIARQDVLDNFSRAVVFEKYSSVLEAMVAGKNAVTDLLSRQPTLPDEVAEKLVKAEYDALK